MRSLYLNILRIGLLPLAQKLRLARPRTLPTSTKVHQSPLPASHLRPLIFPHTLRKNTSPSALSTRLSPALSCLAIHTLCAFSALCPYSIGSAGLLPSVIQGVQSDQLT